MASDLSGLVTYLQGGKSLRESAGMDADQIINALRKGAAVQSGPLDLFKDALLARAAEIKALGSI